ncbi:MAG: hypothetical protein WCO65_03020 [bacterium]
MMKKIQKPNDLKEVLPSKKFVKTILICIGSCVVILLIANYFGSRSAFSKPAVSIKDSATISDLLVQDSNNNGIPDWEESLYGLDPKGDGISNKKIISDKKIQSKQANGIVDGGDTSVTETGKLSREMLSTILALQQSGNLTSAAVDNLTNTLGTTVNAKRDTVPTYTIDNITVVDDSAKAMAVYEKGFSVALATSQKSDVGNELSIIYQALDEKTGKDKLAKLDSYAAGYAKLASDIVAIKTPQKISQKSLAFANACSLMSHALKKIEVMYSDAPTGMIGFDEYTTARDAIVNGTSDITNSFVN